MPHTTHQFGFEAKVGRWAGQTSERLMGRLAGFILVLDAGGVAQALHCEPGESDFAALHRELEAAGAPHLFYDPLEDGMEYIWLSWREIAQPVMERLIGAPFEAADFLDRTSGSRVAYPPTWGVMF